MNGIARFAVRATVVAAVLTALAFLLRGHRDGGEVAAWTRHELREAAPDRGRAFRAELPRGAPSFDAGEPKALVLEDGRAVGAVAGHDEIRELGGGRYSFWRGTAYFSSSDGSDPRTNGRRYEAAWPSALASVEFVARIGAWIAGGLGGTGWLLLLLRRPLVALKTRRRLVAKVLLVPASLLVVTGALEVGLRIRYPFAESTWPGRFDPAFGFTFEPGAIVRQTNLYDFCCEQRANALGFLDREVPAELPPGTRRIVVLGDSFVEAVQVPIEAKFHVLLEQALAARGVANATAAFGMSGCGTSNELQLYERFGSGLRADLVILLVVNNDFANNSALLEAVRNGWHPGHLPRLFLAEQPGGAVRLPTDGSYRDHLIPIRSPAPPPRSFWQWSRLYAWTRAGIASVDRSSVQQTYDAYAERRAWLCRQPEWALAFDGWKWPDDDDLDTMTATAAPPPVFAEALRLTEAALAALRDRAAADGARLLVVGCHNLGTARSEHGRRIAEDAWRGILAAMCGRLDLPVLDLHAAFGDRGVLDEVTFVRDGHWNEIGHAAAARAIDEHLRSHPGLLGGR